MKVWYNKNPENMNRGTAFSKRLHESLVKIYISLRIWACWSESYKTNCWLPRIQNVFKRTAKTLVKLREWAGWSESSLCAHAILQGMLCPGSNVNIVDSRYLKHWYVKLVLKSNWNKHLSTILPVQFSACSLSFNFFSSTPIPQTTVISNQKCWCFWVR